MKQVLLWTLLLLSLQAKPYFENDPLIHQFDFVADSGFLNQGDHVTAVLLYTYDDAVSRQFAKVWSQVAQVFRGIVKIAAADLTDVPIKRELGTKTRSIYIQIYFGNRRLPPGQHSGPLSFEDIVAFIKDHLNRVIEHGTVEQSDEPLIANLSERNFEDRVLNSRYPWVIKFTAPWCSHCKTMKAPWDSVAQNLTTKFAFGDVNCELHEKFCFKFGIDGLPTIFVFPAKSNSETKPIVYDGPREHPSVAITQLQDIYTQLKQEEPKISQLVEPEMFETECLKSTNGCAIIFLPQIQSLAEEARQLIYLKNLHILMAELARFNFNFMWSFGRDQPDMESTYPIGEKYTSALVIFSKTKRCSGMEGQGKFSYKTLKAFLSDAFQNRAKQYTLPQIMPPVQYVNEWRPAAEQSITAEDDLLTTDL